MVTISVCMIVKNEEKVLARCLESLKGLWDELVIVDTGSSDQTKSIAKKYTDQIYDFTWTGRFCDARNFAFSKASMEYIYSADADEVLDEKNRERFRILKEALLPEVEIVQMKYGNQLAFDTVYNFDEEYRPKLFRRERSFQWMDAIHETIRTMPVVFDSDIVITHLPEQNHAGRDLAAFARLTRQGETLSDRLFDLYARELYMAGDVPEMEEAEAYFEARITQQDMKEEALMKALCVAARTARLTGDLHRFMKYTLKAVVLKGCSEICLELGQYYLAEKEYGEAELWLYNAAFETEPVLDLRSHTTLPLELLVQCCKAAGKDGQAAEYEKYLQKRS